MGASYRERHGPVATTTSQDLAGTTGNQPEPEDTGSSYDTMTLAELRALAESRGLKTYGSKGDIAQRLTEADQ